MTPHVSEHARKRFAQRFPSYNLLAELEAARPISHARLSKRTEIRRQDGHTYLRSANSGAIFVIVNETVVVTVRRIDLGNADLAERHDARHAHRRKTFGGRRKLYKSE